LHIDYKAFSKTIYDIVLVRSAPCHLPDDRLLYGAGNAVVSLALVNPLSATVNVPVAFTSFR
jgi:hypothetical protein